MYTPLSNTMNDDTPIDDDTIERLRAAKATDESVDAFVNRLCDTYDKVRVAGYQEIGVDPLAGREDAGDE